MKETIINQGAAGCIFQYGFDCKGNKINTQKFITKIQRNEKLSNNEYEIGQKIRNIPDYENYFAPVLECCTVSLAKYDSDEIEKCEFIQNAKGKGKGEGEGGVDKTYKMCKIQYVGKNTLGDHIYDVFKNTPLQLIKTMASTYTYLLKSLKIMADNNIVHYDIKDNNIVCNDVNTPILIDFGRSIDMTQTKTDVTKYKDIFFLYEPDFDYWCLDINFLMYAFNEVGDKWEQHVVTKEVIQGILNDFFTGTAVAKTIEKSQPEYKKKQTAYFMGFEGKKWIDVFQELIKFMKTWDNYALAVTYVDMMVYFTNSKTPGTPDDPIISKFNDLLVEIIASTPDERPSLEKTIEKSLELFTVEIKRENIRKIGSLVKRMSQNEEHADKLFDTFKKSKVAQLRKDAVMNARYGIKV